MSENEEVEVVEKGTPVDLTETTDSAETTIIGDPAETPEQQIASKADVDKLSDEIGKMTEAIKELTKVVGENTKENIKWFRAGKM